MAEYKLLLIVADYPILTLHSVRHLNNYPTQHSEKLKSFLFQCNSSLMDCFPSFQRWIFKRIGKIILTILFSCPANVLCIFRDIYFYVHFGSL